MNNSTTMNGTTILFISDEDKIPLIILWMAIVIVGVVGNTLTIYVICRHTVKSATTIFILSLAIADLTFITFVVPLNLVFFTTNDTVLLDNEELIFIDFVKIITVHVTCWTLMAMTIDRYLAIVYPVKSLKWRTKKTSVKVSIGVWIVSVVLSIPVLFSYIMHLDLLTATLLGVVLTSYGIPLSVVVICYMKIISVLCKRNKEMLQKTGETNTRKKTRGVVKMVAVLIFLFAVSWCPIQVLNMWSFLDPNFTYSSRIHKFRIIALTLAYANSCINPFVYAFMNKKIRKAMVAKLGIKHARA